MRYLIDTDWVISHFRQVERITRTLDELIPDGLALSIISLAELYEGVYYSRDPLQSEVSLREFLNPELAILPIDDETCLRHNLTLLSNNRRHFEQVEGLAIISA